MNDRITVNPNIMVGKPVIRGTRITVEYVLELLEQGWPIEKIIAEHPRLTKPDILAVLAYARENVAQEKIYPLSHTRARA